MNNHTTNPLFACLTQLTNKQTEMFSKPWVRDIAQRYVNALGGNRTLASNDVPSIAALAHSIAAQSRAKQLGVIASACDCDEEIRSELVALLQSSTRSPNLIAEDFTDGVRSKIGDRLSLHVFALLLVNWEVVEHLNGPKQLSDLLLEQLPHELSEGIKENPNLAGPFYDRIRKMAKRAGMKFVGQKPPTKPSRITPSCQPFRANPSQSKMAA